MNETIIKTALPIFVAEVKTQFLDQLPTCLSVEERRMRIQALNTACANIRKMKASYFLDE